MNKKKRKKTIKAVVEVTPLLHRLLTTSCRCTQQEIAFLDHVLQKCVPQEDASYFQDIVTGAIPPSQEAPPSVLLDLGDGTIQRIRLNVNHPHFLQQEYLEKKYGRRFGTLYWFAFGENPKSFYAFLLRHHRAPFFRTIIEEGSNACN